MAKARRKTQKNVTKPAAKVSANAPADPDR